MEPLFQCIQEHKKATKNSVKCQVVCALIAAGLRDSVLIYIKNNSQSNDNRVSPEYKTNVTFTTVEK